MPSEQAALEKLRRICLALPGATEVTAWGHPNFKVAKKTFAAFERYQGEWAIAVKVDKGHQEHLMTSDPRFYASPYVGARGWVSMKIAGRVSWKQVKALVVESYRSLAPKKLLAALDDGGPSKSRTD